MVKKDKTRGFERSSDSRHRFRKKYYREGAWHEMLVHTAGRLGSGLFDKYDRELFEGDKVLLNGSEQIIYYEHGAFWCGQEPLFLVLKQVELIG